MAVVMVEQIAKLNASANMRSKGRDDLGADVLEAALAALREEPALPAQDAARVIARHAAGWSPLAVEGPVRAPVRAL